MLLTSQPFGLFSVTPDFVHKTGYSGQWYNTSSIIPANPNTAYPIPHTSTTYQNGIVIQNDSFGSPTLIKFQFEGTYVLTTSYLISNNSGGTHSLDQWFRYNGETVTQNIANSASFVQLSNNNDTVLATVQFLFPNAAANDTVQLVYSVNNTAMRLLAKAAQAGLYPAAPSIITTIIQV